MTAYFDFYIDDKDRQFKKAREVVKKYENYPITTFKNMFKKIKVQLDEIDKIAAGRVGQPQGSDEVPLDPKSGETATGE